MKCPRCGGFMVQDNFLDLRESNCCLAVWRCVQCGEVVDPVIAANRNRQLAAAKSFADSSHHETTPQQLTKAA